MKVILIEDVPRLGKVGEVVKVQDGYARNYLIPQKKALDAREGNVRHFEHQKRIMEGKRKKKVLAAQEIAGKMSGLQLTFQRRAGENEKLFGSVTSMDLEKALADQGYAVSRKDIALAEPIKSLGIHSVTVRLFQDVSVAVKVAVEPEEVKAEEAPKATE